MALHSSLGRSKIEVNFRRLVRATERQILNEPESKRIELYVRTLEEYLEKLQKLSSNELAQNSTSIDELSLVSYASKLQTLKDLLEANTLQQVSERHVEASDVSSSTTIDKPVSSNTDGPYQGVECDTIDTNNELAEQCISKSEAMQQPTHEYLEPEKSNEFAPTSISTGPRESSTPQFGQSFNQQKLELLRKPQEKPTTSKTLEEVAKQDMEERERIANEMVHLTSSWKESLANMNRALHSGDRYVEDMSKSSAKNLESVDKGHEKMTAMMKESSMSFWFYSFAAVVVLIVWISTFMFLRIAPNLSG